MRKYLPVLIFFINLLLLGKIQVVAQTPPKTIKLGTFSPPPTRTPTRTPTKTPTRTPTSAVPTITGQIPTSSATDSPEPTNSDDGGGNNGGDPADCAKIGLSMYVPQPRFLESTTLCEQGTIWPPYLPSFVPSNLTNLDNALGVQFWVRTNSIKIKSGITGNLASFLEYMEKQPGCTVFVGYGYRSYAEQEGLWYGNDCPTNPGCGVAPPGKSSHQAGIALDLFCAEMIGSDINLKVVPAAAITNAKNFDFIHPVSWDTPHFIGL